MVRGFLALSYLELTACLSERDAHIPDMRTQDGFLDVVTLGCVLELNTPLDRARYNERHDPSSPQARAAITQENQARTMFRVLMKVFSTKYTIQVEGQLVHPSCVWHAVLVSFAVGIVNCITTKAHKLVFEPGVSPAAVRVAVRDHFRRDHPHLVDSFDARLDLHKQDVHLSWQGPAFDVIRKGDNFEAITSALGIAEHKLSFDLGDIYSRDTSPDSVNRYYDGIWAGEDDKNDHD